MSSLFDVTQKRFTERVRHRANFPLPDALPAQRVAVYERLVHNNIAGFLRGSFPVLHRIMPAQRWAQLAAQFVSGHACESPYFHEIGLQFIQWLQQGYVPEPEDPSFLLELAHYEWVELALDIAEQEPPPEPGSTIELDTPLIWSDVAWPLAYQWPVQLIGEGYSETVPPAQPTVLMVWRDRADTVRFMQLTPFAWQLACTLSELGGSLAERLPAVAASCGLVDDVALRDGSLRLIRDWAVVGVLGAGASDADSA